MTGDKAAGSEAVLSDMGRVTDTLRDCLTLWGLKDDWQVIVLTDMYKVDWQAKPWDDKQTHGMRSRDKVLQADTLDEKQTNHMTSIHKGWEADTWEDKQTHGMTICHSDFMWCKRKCVLTYVLSVFIYHNHDQWYIAVVLQLRTLIR